MKNATIWIMLLAIVVLALNGLVAVYDRKDITTRLDALEEEERTVEIYYHNVDPDTMPAVEKEADMGVCSLKYTIPMPRPTELPSEWDKRTDSTGWSSPHHIITIPPVELPEKGGPK